MDNVQDAIMMDQLAVNGELLTRIRSVTAILAGICAGILGITGWAGAILFLAHTIVVATVLRFVCGTRAKSYLAGGSGELFTFGSLCNGALTYVMLWTFVYDSIYIF